MPEAGQKSDVRRDGGSLHVTEGDVVSLSNRALRRDDPAEVPVGCYGVMEPLAFRPKRHPVAQILTEGQLNVGMLDDGAVGSSTTEGDTC